MEPCHNSDSQTNFLLSATELQVDLFINVLVLGGFLLFMGFIIEGLQVYSLKRQRKVAATPATLRRRNFYRQFSLALAWASFTCVFAASIANTQAIRGLERSSKFSITTGTASLGLHWTTWILSLFFSFGLTMLRRRRSGGNPQTSSAPTAIHVQQ